MVAQWRQCTTCNSAGTCTWSAGTAAQWCVPSRSSTIHVRDRGTALMMRKGISLCRLHGGLTACSALLRFTVRHGHRNHVVTSSCLAQPGHASTHGCHIARCSGTSTMHVYEDSQRGCSIRRWRVRCGLHLLST